MFSSQSLVHLVFADPMDDYYSGLLKLDLDHFLWLKLHERFSSVYFLRKAERGFSVSTFGDKGATPFESNPGKLSKLKDAFSGKSSIQRFGDWMLEQLCGMRSEAAALVCPAEDFVSVTKGPEWEQILRRICGAKNRTGILVLTLPLQAERSRELLDQNLFRHLGDAAISNLPGGNPRDLFPALKKEKGDACTVLAPYAGSCLHSLLLRLQMEDPRFLLPEADAKRVERYLHRYLPDLRLQQEAPLLSGNAPAVYLSCRDLYLRLKEPRVWDGLLSLSRQEAAGEETYADALVPPDREGAAGRCLTRLFAASGSFGCADVRQSQIPGQILRRLLWPRNEKEHPEVVEALSDFLQRLSHTDPKDRESRRKILEAMRFCSDWLCVPDGSETGADVLALIERQKIDLELSRLAFESADNQQRLEETGGKGTLYESKLKQARDLATAYRLNAEQYHELIKSSMMDLSLSRFSGKEVFEQLSALENSFKAQTGETAELSEKHVSQTSQESEPPQQEQDPDDPDKLTPEQKKIVEAMLYNM